MYKIGELSKLCKISVKTLRYYDSEGLLIPDKVDIFTGYRYYSASKLDDCNRIVSFKELGFTLDEIKKQMNAKDSNDILALIEAKKQELTDIKTQTESQLKRLCAIKDSITGENEKMYNVIIRNSDTLRIAFKRKIFTDKNEAYLQINDIHNQLPVSSLGKRNVIINYETEYTEKDFDLAIGVEILNKLPKDSGFEEKTINFPSEVASLVCKKSELEDAYSAMLKQLQNICCQIIGAFYEIYHDDGTVELKVPVCRLSERAENPRIDDINVPFVNDALIIGHWKLIDCLPTKEHFNTNKIKFNGQQQIKELYFLPNGEQYWCYRWTKGFVISSYGYPYEQGLNKYTIEIIDDNSYMFIEMKDNEYCFYNGMPEIWVFKQTDTVSYSKNDIRIKDDTDLPFVNDEAVIGKWTVCDYIKEIKEFNPQIPNSHFSHEEMFWKTVEFVTDGNCKISYKNGNYEKPCYSWTKNYVLGHVTSVAEHYEAHEFNNCTYLFIEWKSGDYAFGGRKPCYYVFKRS